MVGCFLVYLMYMFAWSNKWFWFWFSWRNLVFFQAEDLAQSSEATLLQAARIFRQLDTVSSTPTCPKSVYPEALLVSYIVCYKVEKLQSTRNTGIDALFWLGIGKSILFLRELRMAILAHLALKADESWWNIHYLSNHIWHKYPTFP